MIAAPVEKRQGESHSLNDRQYKDSERSVEDDYCLSRLWLSPPAPTTISFPTQAGDDNHSLVNPKEFAKLVTSPPPAVSLGEWEGILYDLSLKEDRKDKGRATAY